MIKNDDNEEDVNKDMDGNSLDDGEDVNNDDNNDDYVHRDNNHKDDEFLNHDHEHENDENEENDVRKAKEVDIAENNEEADFDIII